MATTGDLPQRTDTILDETRFLAWEGSLTPGTRTHTRKWSQIRTLVENIALAAANITTPRLWLGGATGEVARTLTAHISEFVFPESFGAVGDGTTNDTAALQAALNTGKIVRLSKGKWYAVSALNAVSGGGIIGAGWTGGLKRVANHSGTTLGLVNVDDVDGFTAENFACDGQKATFAGPFNVCFYTQGNTNATNKYARNIFIRKIKMFDTDYGVVLYGNTGLDCWNVYVEDCTILDTTAHPINILIGWKDVFIRNNRIKNYGLTYVTSGGSPGITAGRQSVGLVVEGNSVVATTAPAGNSAHGLSIEESEATVTGNLVDGATGYGIEVAFSGGSVTGNRLKNCDRPGINIVADVNAGVTQSTFHQKVTISGNSIENCGGGIHSIVNNWDNTTRHKHLVISGNQIHGTKNNATAQSFGRGIQLQHLDQSVLIGNVVTGTYKTGIWVESNCGEILVIGNVSIGNYTSQTGDVDVGLVVKAVTTRNESRYGTTMIGNLGRQLAATTLGNWSGGFQTQMDGAAAALQSYSQWGGNLLSARTGQTIGHVNTPSSGPNAFFRNLNTASVTLPTATAANLASAAHAINTTNKLTDTWVLASDTGVVYRAAGTSTTSNWVPIGGGSAITPA